MESTLASKRNGFSVKLLQKLRACIGPIGLLNLAEVIFQKKT